MFFLSTNQFNSLENIQFTFGGIICQSGSFPEAVQSRIIVNIDRPIRLRSATRDIDHHAKLELGTEPAPV